MSDFSKIDDLPSLSLSNSQDAKVLDTTLSQAKQRNPDLEKQYLDISNEYQMPVNFVRDNYDNVNKMIAAKQEDPQLFVEKYPNSSKWFSNQENANLSSDSIEKLQQYESILSDVKSEKEIKDSGGRLAWSAKAVGSRASQLAGNLISIAGKNLEIGPQENDVDQFEEGSIYQQLADANKEARGSVAGKILNAPSHYLELAGSSLADVDLGQPNVDTWARYKGDWTDPSKLADFVISQSGSVMDMVGVAVAMPAYIASRTEEIASQRADNDKEKEASPKDYAVGTVTAVASSLFERLGAKFVLGSFLDDAARLSHVSQVPTSVAKGAAVEGATEFGQEQIEYLGETAGTKKELSLEDSIDRGLAGLVGGVSMGGGIRAATGSYEAATHNRYQAELKSKLARQTEEFQVKADDTVQARQSAHGIQQAIETLRETAAAQRGADIESLSQSITDNGGPQNLSFDAQAIIDAATNNDINISDLSLQMLGSRDVLSQSAQAGTAVTIPLKTYMSSDLALKAHESLEGSMLVDDNSMSLDDAKEWDDELAQTFVDSVNRVNDEWNDDDSAVNDMYRQLIASGQTESYARSASSLYRFMNVVTQRGVSQEFMDQFQFSVGREVSDSLQQQIKGSQFDSLLDDLRNGNTPEPSDYMGENLMDFVIKKGGLLPDSDLDAMDVDVGRVGRNRVTRLSGIDPDQMAEYAFDAGYIQSPDLSVFMDALDSQERGDNIYSEQNADQGVRERAEALDRLSHDLDLAQIDINEMSNQEINDLIGNVEGESLDQTDESKNLAVVHNITEEGIRKANELGGLASPSIAVANTEIQGFDNFGEISLMADPELLNDPKIRTFDTDIYSSRQPRPDEEIDSKKSDKFIFDVSESTRGTKLRDPSGYVNSQSSLDTEGTQFHYLKSIDKAPTPKKMKETALSKLVKGKSVTQVAEEGKFAKAVAKKNKKTIDDIKKADPTIDQDVLDSVAETMFERSLPEGYEIKQNEDGKYQAYDPDGNAYWKAGASKSLVKRRVAALLSKEGINGEIDYSQPKADMVRSELDKAQAVNDGVDMEKLRADIKRKMAVKKTSTGYDKWLSETYDSMVKSKRMFMGYTNSGDRKYKPYTLENIVNEMNKKVQGGESSSYGVASVRAMYANEMKNVKAVQAMREKFTTSEDMAEIKGEAERKFEDALEELKQYYEYDSDSWGYANDVAEAITEGPKGIREAFGGSAKANKIINELGAYLAALPSEYFEAKATRAVDFGEFNTAIVPKGTSKDITDLLKSKGVKIKKYDPSIEGSRNELIKSQEKLLFQKERGSISIDRAGKRYRINLNEKSDLSTFLHESGHLFFEVMTEAYNAGEGDQQLRNDYETLVENIGGKVGEELSSNQLEVFAEQFEQYLREGKAPAQELQSSFQSFGIWLKNIYRTVRDILRVGGKQLNDDVRGVMDRMLATDAEIQAANDGLNLNQLFEEKPEWFTDDMWTQYQSDQKARREAQESNLNNQKINDIKRANTEWWQSELKRTKEEVSNEVDETPVYQLRALLRSNKPKTPSGEILDGVEHYSLDKQATINLMGDVFVNGGVDSEGNKIKPALPRSVYAVKGRSPVPPQMLFDSFPGEFQSPFDMVQSIASAPERTAYINAEANNRMSNRHGDINTNQADAYIAAVEGAHDERVTSAMVSEINAIAPAVGGYTVTREAFKKSAEIILNGMQMRAIRPNNYRRGEIKHGSNAFKAMQEGDLKTAKKERELQLLNFYLYNQSIKLKKFEDSSYKKARSMSSGGKVKTLQKAGDHYLNQMASVLNQYEFKKMSNKQLAKRKGMQQWLKETLESAEMGNPTVQDEIASKNGESVLREQEQSEDAQGSTPNFEAESNDIINYRELTPTELRDVMDMVDSIYTLAKLKSKLLKSKDKRDFNQAVNDLVESINDNGTQESRSPEDQGAGDYEALKRFAISSRTPASVIRELDGFSDGGQAWELLLRPLQEAEAEASIKLKKAQSELDGIWNESYSKADLKSMQTKKYDNVVGRSFSRYDVLSFLMNWGTESNRERVRIGHGINDMQVQHLFDTYLQESDFEFATKMWKQLDSYWQATSDLHKDFYGFTPERVEPLKFNSKYGEMTGGYYPIKYDPSHSVKAEQNDAKNILQQSFSTLGKKIQMGTTKQRTTKGLGRPLLLDVNRVTMGHVFDAVRKTSMDRAIYDAGRMISNQKVKSAIVDNFGVIKYGLIRDAIGKSRDGVQEVATGTDAVVNSLRNNASIAMLGMSLRTIVLQPFGLANSVARLQMSGIGKTDFLNAYAKYMMNPNSTMKMVRDKSEYMRGREDTQRAEISRLNKQMKANILNGGISKANDFIRDRAMIPMMKVQLWTVDMPTWTAAYEKFKKTHSEDTAIQLADQALRDAQGGGDTMDIAQSMNGGSWSKLFTNFLSYMLTTYNLQVQNVKTNKPTESLKAGELGKVLRSVDNTFLLLVMPAVLNMMLNAFSSGETPDDGEELADQYLKEQIGFLLGMNPITAQFSGITSGFDYSGPQGLTIVGKSVTMGKILGSDDDLDEILASDRFIKDAIWVGGLATGLPAAQINRTIWGTKQALENGESVPKTLKQAMFGKEYN